MGLRSIVSICTGALDAEGWAEVAAKEPPIRGRAKACAGCPLREGGEWEAGATAAIAKQTPAQRAAMQRWGCHVGHGPCAGMRRLLKTTMTSDLNPPDKPAKGQRWRYDGKERAREFEVVDLHGAAELRVRLRNVDGGDGRVVEWYRLRTAYVYLGDFAVPVNYSIHELMIGPGGHCFRDPFGYIEGPPEGRRWTWKQARDAAVEHAATNSRICRKKG